MRQRGANEGFKSPNPKHGRIFFRRLPLIKLRRAKNKRASREFVLCAEAVARREGQACIAQIFIQVSI